MVREFWGEKSIHFRHTVTPVLAVMLMLMLMDGCTHFVQRNEDEHGDAHQWSEDEKTAHHTGPGAG